MIAPTARFGLGLSGDAGMAELVDAPDSKSGEVKLVSVRARLPVCSRALYVCLCL